MLSTSSVSGLGFIKSRKQMTVSYFTKILGKVPIIENFKANMAHNNSSINQEGEPEESDFLEFSKQFSLQHKGLLPSLNLTGSREEGVHHAHSTHTCAPHPHSTGLRLLKLQTPPLGVPSPNDFCDFNCCHHHHHHFLYFNIKSKSTLVPDCVPEYLCHCQ